MEEVIRQAVIDELESAITDSDVVTVSSIAGGGLSTVLDQWARSTEAATVLESHCAGFTPQRPLAAFGDLVDEETRAFLAAGDRSGAVKRMCSVLEPGVVLSIDDCDRIDEASAQLASELCAQDVKLVLGHHHSPSTNPAMELLIASARRPTQVVIPPLDTTEVGLMMGDPERAAPAHDSTGGNPLAVTLFSTDFVSIGASVLERFDRLPPDGQAVAAILSASPESLPLTMFEAMGRPWDSHGAPVERSGLATVAGNGASCLNDKIRRVLYEEMTAVRRRFVHSEILAHLHDSEDLTVLMHHAVGAGDVETIITMGPQAAAAAEQLGAYREAIGHLRNVLTYEHSVPEADRAALQTALDRCLEATVGSPLTP